MGPRSGDHGNESITAGAPYMLTLQWGRDLVIAEIGGDRHRSGGRRLASMGPRSGDRGNDGYPLRAQLAGTAASMGPRSGDRGNQPDEIEDTPRAQSFNGAAIW